MEQAQYRKSVRHYDLPGHAHELTFSCYKRRSLLSDETHREIVGRAISAAAGRHDFMVVAFVLMPEHVHLLVFPRSDRCRVSDVLFAIKRPSSYRIKKRLIETNDTLVEQLTIRERPGKMTFRFWQEGGGYDRNLITPKAIRASIQYLHENPVRRGLCELPEQWLWSSFRQWNEPGFVVPAGVPVIDRLTF